MTFSSTFKQSQRTLGSQGFTLIEILIAITLLAFMSFGIYQIMSQTYTLRDTLMGEGDFYSEIRIGLSILDRDLTGLYGPAVSRIPANPGTGAAPTAGQGASAPATPPPDLVTLFGVTAADRGAYWGPVVNRLGTRMPRFLGTERSVQFVGTTHTRTVEDSLESIFSKIRYELKDGSLVRFEKTNAFALEDLNGDNIRDPQREYLLFRGISKAAFRYYKRDRDQWSSNWDSERPETRDLTPDLIELRLTVQDGDKRTFEGKLVSHPEYLREGLNATY